MRRYFILSLVLISGCSIRERKINEPIMSMPHEPLKAVPRLVEEQKSVDLQNAYFDYDKAVLLPAAKIALRHDVEWLKKNRQAHIQVEGYCDESGSYEYNLELGQKRADAAKAYLRSLGIADSRIDAVGVGRIVGAGDDTRAKNRRAGFIVIFDN